MCFTGKMASLKKYAAPIHDYCLHLSEGDIGSSNLLGKSLGLSFDIRYSKREREGSVGQLMIPAGLDDGALLAFTRPV